jgi:hypothetical protein
MNDVKRPPPRDDAGRENRKSDAAIPEAPLSKIFDPKQRLRLKADLERWHALAEDAFVSALAADFDLTLTRAMEEVKDAQRQLKDYCHDLASSRPWTTADRDCRELAVWTAGCVAQLLKVLAEVKRKPVKPFSEKFYEEAMRSTQRWDPPNDDVTHPEVMALLHALAPVVMRLEFDEDRPDPPQRQSRR